MRVAIIGAGGVGGYFGGRLALSGADVAFVARGDHLQAIQERGLDVRAVDGDFTVRVQATDEPSAIGPVDIVVFSVKSYDTESAGLLLRPLIEEDTAVISVQNGIDNEDKLARIIGRGHVVGGAAFILAHIEAPGVVVQVAGPRTLVFGELDGTRSERLERFAGACTAAGFGTTISDDIRKVLWDKYAFLTAMAGVTAASRLPMDAVLATPESRNLYQQLMREVVAVAKAEGVDLDASIVDDKTTFAEGLGANAYASMYYDLVAGKRFELDALYGELTRRAKRHGVRVPAADVIYALLRPWELRTTT